MNLFSRFSRNGHTARRFGRIKRKPADRFAGVFMRKILIPADCGIPLLLCLWQGIMSWLHHCCQRTPKNGFSSLQSVLVLCVYEQTERIRSVFLREDDSSLNGFYGHLSPFFIADSHGVAPDAL